MMKIDTSILIPIVTVPCLGTENYSVSLNKENATKIHVNSPIILYKGFKNIPSIRFEI